jgi:hypothetical protein
MIGAREVAPNIVCIGVRIVIAIISIDIVEDKQPVGVVLLNKPAHDLLDNYIDAAVLVYRVCVYVLLDSEICPFGILLAELAMLRLRVSSLLPSNQNTALTLR